VKHCFYLFFKNVNIAPNIYYYLALLVLYKEITNGLIHTYTKFYTTGKTVTNLLTCN